MTAPSADMRELFRRLEDSGARPDWADVLARARAARRRQSLLAALAVAVLFVFAGSAIALAHGLGLLGGTRVRLSPSERFELSLVSGGRLRGAYRIASRDGQGFYVVRLAGAGPCYAVGPASGLTPAQIELGLRFENMICAPPFARSMAFPSRSQPILDFSEYRLPAGAAPESGPPLERMSKLRGFAADPVAKVGVIGPKDRIVYAVPVIGNVYVGTPPDVVVVGLVAFDRRGKVITAQCAAFGGCGRFSNSPVPPPAAGQPSLRPAAPPPHLRQHASLRGASVRVVGTSVTVRIRSLSRLTRWRLRSGDHKITVTCFRLAGAGGQLFARLNGVKTVLAPLMRVVMKPQWIVGPFDGCSVSGRAQPLWSDGSGTHDPIEIPFTARAHRYFEDRAVARALATLAVDQRFRFIRYAKVMPAATTVAQRLGGRVVALRNPSATPRLGKIGLWTGPQRHIVLVERSTTGRRLYLDYRNGVIYQTNFAWLTGIW